VPIKINKYINGVPPFEMNLNILKEAVYILKNIHSTLAPGIKLSSPKGLSKYENKRFLHGDLTPSNMLVSNNRIIGILDFEHCFIGPIEWDLARCLVFSWFRMPEKTGFEEALNLIVKVYGSDLVNKKLLLKFSIRNAQTYLHNIVKHKEKYAEGIIHTNTIEGFWSIIKNQIVGTDTKGLSYLFKGVRSRYNPFMFIFADQLFMNPGNLPKFSLRKPLFLS